MGKATDYINESTAAWISNQHMFFVGTAPETHGRVNLSPKGLDSLRVLDDRSVAYLDLTGSGVETIAHVRQNGRITLMFCAFDGPARIVRVYGAGHVHLPGSPTFNAHRDLFPERRGVRSIITIDVDRVQDACGYGVPNMEFVADRTRLDSWVDAQSDEDIETYWAERNATSIDELSGLDR
jgi:hypothetical protein